jgi:hypothetical protein
MKWVWKELGNDPDKLRLPHKLKQFLFVAYDAACHRRPVVTMAELEEEAAKYAFGVSARRWIDTRVASGLDETARAMRARSRKFGADPPILERGRLFRPPLVVVSQHEPSDLVRAYVLELSRLTCKLFTSPHLKTVATTASVALQCKVTQNQVKKWISKQGCTP